VARWHPVVVLTFDSTGLYIVVMYYPPLPSHTQHATADSGHAMAMAGSRTWANHANSKQHIEQISNNKQHITVRTGGVLYFNTYTTHNTYRTAVTPYTSLQPAAAAACPTANRHPPTANRQPRCAMCLARVRARVRVPGGRATRTRVHKSQEHAHTAQECATCVVRPGPRCNTHGARRPLAHAHAATGRNPSSASSRVQCKCVA
jgi:hypothetical protein